MTIARSVVRRRLPFFATTSLGLLVLAGGACLSLAPGKALAANECGVVIADPVTCLPGTYASGITYAGADVPLVMRDAVVVTSGGVNITATGQVTIGMEGVTPDNGDLSFTSTTGAGLSVVTTGGVFIDLNDPDSGDTPGFITGLSGVVVQSTGTFLDLANLAITSTSSASSARGVLVQSADGMTVYTRTVNAQRTGVEGVSVDGGVDLYSSTLITAGDDGIVGRATGTGSVSISTGAITAGANGIVASTVSGDITVNAGGPIDAGAGLAILVNSGGSATVNLGAGADLTRADVSITQTGAFNFGNAGRFTSASGLASDLVLQQTGTSATLGNTGTLIGAVDFSAVTSNLGFVNNGTWQTGGTSEFTDGDDTLSGNGQGALSASGATTVDFMDGTDSFVSQGAIYVGAATGASTLTLANLETFTAYGRLVFGGTDSEASDGETNDRLVATGADYNGIDAVMVLDVTLGASQASCAAATAADCLSLAGGSTAGNTYIIVNDTGSAVGTLGGPGLVLVDVAGGTSAADHFQLDASSPNYRDDLVVGPGLDKGFFFYRLDYDAAGKTHRLVAIPDREVFEPAALATAAQSAWHTSTGPWLERQADLRNTVEDGGADGVGAWLRVTNALVDREMDSDFGGDNPGYITSYEQETMAVVGGVDLLRGAAEGAAYVFGVTLGSLTSDVIFDVSPTRARLKGMSYGAYASWVGPGLFLDAIVQGAKLDLDYSTSWNAAGDFGQGDVTSVGAQVEGGWRYPVNDGAAYVEPLASLAYVTTDLSDLALPNADFSADKTTSLRASVGVRLSGDVEFEALTVKGSLAGRLWNEFDGDSEGVVASGGESVGLSDDFGGVFSEVNLGLSVFSPGSRVSAFINTGVKFKDSYLASDTSVGLRVQW